MSKFARLMLFVIGSYGILPILGWLDALTGLELNFFLFYFLPVTIAAWGLGQAHAIVVALFSTAIWFMVNDHGYPLAGGNFSDTWNTVIRLVAFLYVGLIISRLRAALNLAQGEAEVAQRALSEVRVLQSILPICCECKKIRNDDNAWEQLEGYISSRSDTRFSHGYCPDCAKRFLEEAGLEPTSDSAS